MKYIDIDYTTKTKKGDEVWVWIGGGEGNYGWLELDDSREGQIGYEGFRYRRPIKEDEWIKTSDRYPTNEDGDKNGDVLVATFLGNTMTVHWSKAISNSVARWTHIPKFHEEDPYDEWVKSKLGIARDGRDAFNAGRDYEKKQNYDNYESGLPRNDRMRDSEAKEQQQESIKHVGVTQRGLNADF